MGYTVKNLINSNKFPGLQLISDNSGINREIRGVQIIEMPDMENFLGGGWTPSDIADGLWKAGWAYDAKSVGRIK